MANLATNYMGIQLKNPILAGSSGLTNDVNYLKQLEQAGVGAVVLKSVFEEQIQMEALRYMESDDESAMQWRKSYEELLAEQPYLYEEAYEYLSGHAKSQTLNQYLKFISEAKKQLKIPVIASIHCVSQYNWSYFARKIEEAGADALELNIYVLPSDINRSGNENEQVYFDIVNQLKRTITIPIALKTGNNFSSMQTLIKLSETGIKGLVMFNRPYHPDIDIRSLKLTSSFIYSNNEEYIVPLRWIALLSDHLQCDIAASGGIHSYETVVKMLLAGASVVQITSALYRNGPDIVTQMLSGVENWMEEKGFRSIDEFQGMLSRQKIGNPAEYERVQFIKLYSKNE